MFGWKLGLDRIRAILREIGEPQRQFPALHIAGSNGKGSVAYLLERLYQQAGYNTGLFTSPHLISPAERIRIGGKALTGAEFDDSVRAIRPILQKYQATYFEALTAMAFWVFMRKKVHLAIVETGLGGRLDATNVLQPRCCIITSISVEHEQLLGSRLSEIAREKAGILKPGSRCVHGALPPPAIEVVKKECRQKSIPCVSAGEVVAGEMISQSRRRATLRLRLPEGKMLGVETPLIGKHQMGNIQIALAAAWQLRGEFPMDRQSMIDALQTITIPGRFQVLSIQPETVVDVAHNAESMMALIDTLLGVFPGRPFIVVLGLLQDKPAEAILSAWKNLEVYLICTTPRSQRGLPAGLLWQKGQSLGLAGESCPGMDEAWRRARELATPQSVVVVTGSHYVVGPFLQMSAPGG